MDLLTMVDEAESSVKKERMHQTAKPKKGRMKSARAEARERVAAIAGVTPDALRKAEERALVDSDHWEPDGHGFPVPHVVVSDARENRQDLFEIHRHLRKAMSVVAGMYGGAMPDSRCDELHSRLKELMGVAKSYSPDALCPYCKGVQPNIKTCTECGSTGAVNDLDFAAAPEHIKAPFEPSESDDYNESDECTADAVNDALVFSNDEYDDEFGQDS